MAFGGLKKKENNKWGMHVEIEKVEEKVRRLWGTCTS